MIYAFIDKQRQDLALSDIELDKVYDNHTIYVDSDNKVYVHELVTDLIEGNIIKQHINIVEEIVFNEGDIIYTYGESLSTALDLKDIGFRVIDVNFKIVNGLGVPVIREL